MSLINSDCPRLIVAGTNSGVGKTSVSLALAAAFRKRGLKVQSFKVGPDFLDPTYHAIATGNPCYNLDSWMSDPDYIQSLFARKSQSVDLAIIEGVMGLFDGSDPVENSGSTAEIAALLDAPVLLILNTHGMAKSVAAVAKGFSEFDPGVKIGGIIANRCGSEKHAVWIQESLRAFGQPALVGALPREIFPKIPSRHLGLITANTQNLTQTILYEFASIIERHCNLDQIFEIASSAPPLHFDTGPFPPKPIQPEVKIGYALDSAFHFYYQDNLEALEQAGCRLIPFSPIQDQTLPDNLDGIYLGGGYPEEYAADLAANSSMLRSVVHFAENGKVVLAECGGLMYLTQGIQTLSGNFYEMTGILPVKTKMLQRRKMLGYTEISFLSDSPMGKKGDVLRGHEFHYSEISDESGRKETWSPAYSVTYRRSGEAVKDGFHAHNILAGYVHMHFASKPEVAESFAKQCALTRGSC